MLKHALLSTTQIRQNGHGIVDNLYDENHPISIEIYMMKGF